MDEIIERIKKENDVFSKAKLIRHLLREKEIRVVDLAGKLGMTPAYICHLNRLNTLPEAVIDGYYSKLINISTLFLLSRIKDKQKLIAIYEKVLTYNPTLKEIEDLIHEEIYQISNRGDFIKKEDREKMIDRLKKKVKNAEIKISQTRTRGRIIFEIKGNLEETSKTIKKIIGAMTKESD
jgi:hypothetical protein